jgi:hypothetical protein
MQLTSISSDLYYFYYLILKDITLCMVFILFYAELFLYIAILSIFQHYVIDGALSLFEPFIHLSQLL